MLLQNLVSHQPFHFPDVMCFCAHKHTSHFYLDLLQGTVTSVAMSFNSFPSIPLCFYPHVTFSVNLAISFPNVCCLGHIIKTPIHSWLSFLLAFFFKPVQLFSTPELHIASLYKAVVISFHWWKCHAFLHVIHLIITNTISVFKNLEVKTF